MKLSVRAWLIPVLVALAVAVSGCSGDDASRQGAAAQGSVSVGGETTAGAEVAQTLQDAPLMLSTEQPLPPDFRAAYQRKALIVVEFYEEGEDPFYPQGLEVDDIVNSSLTDLRSEYAEVEFFTYDIDNPGPAPGEGELQSGEYGTLATQLGVGFTPFVAMLAPQEEGYTIENLFQGYVPRAVLDQALFDLAANDTESDTSDVDVTIEGLQLTDTGGWIEYFAVRNPSSDPVNLEGFSLRLLDLETGEATPDSPGVEINDEVRVQPNQTVSIGRLPDLEGANGQQVAGTFEGGQELDLSPGNQVALLDADGAIVDTFTV